MQDRMLFPKLVMVEGERAHDVLFVLKPTIPEKPFRLETVIVDPPAAPALTTTFVGLALIAKSLKW